MTPDPLSTAACHLKHAAPEEWNEFLRAFHSYTGALTATVIEAPGERVLIEQGRARQCLKFIQIFQECDPPPPVANQTQPAP